FARGWTSRLREEVFPQRRKAAKKTLHGISSRLTHYRWRTAGGRGNRLDSGADAYILARKIPERFIDVVVLRDAQQLVLRFRIVNTRQAVETRTTSLIVSGARKNLCGYYCCV